MEPYEYDQPGCDVQLVIMRTLGGDARVIVNGGHPTVYVDVPASEVPAAALALYEAAGLPEPVIIERPKSGSAALLSEGDRELVTVSASPPGGPMNLPGVMLSTGGVGVRLIRDEPLRLAWQLVGAMREAENEPDPDELDALTDMIAQGRGLEGARDQARRILLAGWKREPQ